MRCVETKQRVLDIPERFSDGKSVVGIEGWSSGSHHWEVEVGDYPEWAIGVVKESVNRTTGRKE